MATAKRARTARLRIHVENDPATAAVYHITPALFGRRVKQIPGLAGRIAVSYGKDPAGLDAVIAGALSSDVLLLTGGVSMGDFDLVGAALGRAGCRPIFQRVAIQPGKPLFFGVVEGGAHRRVVVFGLPGNPVSSIVDFLVFARPAIRRMMGSLRPVEPALSVELLDPIRRRPGRRAYLPARIEVTGAGRLAARPLPSMGSADLVALSRANALVIVHETAGDVPAGAELPALLLDDSFRR